MENEKEITKLINVLRQIRNTLYFAGWRGKDAKVSEFCLQQYNNIVTRISELEPSVKNLFTPLPENTSATTLHFAVSELIAYLTEEETEKPRRGCESRRARRRRWRCGKKRWIFGFSPSVERF
jgi:hypothetical protein